MANKRTIKALEELIKTEHMAIGALDAAQEEVDDNKLRKQYRKWRDSHAKQAEALNDRLEDLGGERIEYEVGSGKGQSTIWGKLTSMRDDTSVEGMRIGAERGLKRYIDHIEEVDDPKALGIIRKNLEAKQDEMRWYDEQASKERERNFDTKIEVSREKNRDVEMTNGKKKGGLPFPLLVILGAVGAAAYFLLRKGDEDDYDDYGEDAFNYEGDDTTGQSTSTYGSTSADTSSTSEYSPATSHGSNGGA
ncbi:MAG TPA: ferritin-like domain-containing protein [Chloroflexia bacterium]|nr:ferritin-like domain-containing protein [Chloroflexia bacterium]